MVVNDKNDDDAAAATTVHTKNIKRHLEIIIKTKTASSWKGRLGEGKK